LKKKISLENGTSPLLSRSFSIGLCYVNKLVKKGLTHGVMFEPRFLILSCTRDIVEQYIPLINCIFYCKRNDMIIDCCILHEEDSNFLQIASYITGGSYVKIKYKDALLQYLITSFLPDREQRKMINTPNLKVIDFSTYCFCHQKKIDQAYVCSICLSLFCDTSSTCLICGTRFLGSGTIKKRERDSE